MKLGITATQLGLTPRQRDALHERLVALRPSLVVHGGCIGGDDEADQMAADLGIPRLVFPSTRVDKRIKDEVLRARLGSPVWIHPPKEPLDRNVDIVNAVNQLIACPRQARMVTRSGTWTTVRLARRVLGDVHTHVIGPT